MLALSFVLVAQLAAPVLSFPESGMDDSAAYHGYHTRFYRDAAQNTVQIYLDQREGRVVHVLANAENESIGFSVRTSGEGLVPLIWGSEHAHTSRQGRARVVSYQLTAAAARVDLGWFLLGSMRIERDFQAMGRHRAPFASAPFRLDEIQRLLSALTRLTRATRAQHLAALNATSIQQLRSRLLPTTSVRRERREWIARFVQPSLDGTDTLSIEVRVDTGRVRPLHTRGAIALRAREGTSLPFTVSVATTSRALSPLSRQEIFSATFLDFLAATRRSGDSSRARWLERQVRSVELLSSREKLMAGLPTYGTYFGRDMLVSALMMRPIWHSRMSEFVIASALRKLSPTGAISHEEALGGQAVREAASEYATLVAGHLVAVHDGRRAVADSLVTRALQVLVEHRRVRENYHMIDDELQFPVLLARWLGDPGVSPAQKRSFLLDSSDGGGARLGGVLRELGLVARMTAAYSRAPLARNLIAFAPRDSLRWASLSWRDSGAGYAGGRFAMDVNAIWAPLALVSIQDILRVLRDLGLHDRADAAVLADSAAAPLLVFMRDSARLGMAIARWQGAADHFLVRLSSAEVRQRVADRVAALPPAERAYWNAVPLTGDPAGRDSLEFMALALDGSTRPIPVANSDPATAFFLHGARARGRLDSAEMTRVLRDVRFFVRPYPFGLLIPRVGPVAANDAYAPPGVWRAFEGDPYHGPRVVWGREVNLFLLGVSDYITAAGDTATSPPRAAFVRELRSAVDRVQAAVEASGFHSELWSYSMVGGAPAAVRYGTGADIQLWSTTNLAVQAALWRPRPGG